MTGVARPAHSFQRKGKTMTTVTSYRQFVLVDKEGEVQMNTHQDDSEDPVVGDTIECLLSEAADWADLAVRDFIELELGTKFDILCEEVTRRPLSLAERVALDLLVEKATQCADD